jgi:tRNA(Leu) C34 or U34 (ribose-2'-O)-methylase TrmL
VDENAIAADATAADGTAADGTAADGTAADGTAADGTEPVGVGPWPGLWPADPRYDPELLAGGDRRNVVDRYRYWTVEAIVADLDTRRHGFHVAIENFRHDLNIGTVVRTANAFLAAEVHIVGRKRWNRRGAMVTDRYQHVRRHPDAGALATWAAGRSLTLVAVDNLPGAVPLETVELPRNCVLLFGQEGGGLTSQAREAAGVVCSIAQFGSTRSINVGVAAGIAMHAWIRTYASPDQGLGQPILDR